jgi:basic amino acid/polyamine antiporter, APA family
MVGPLFAQTAWTNVTFVGSEVRDPGKNLVRALLAGCSIVVVLYLLANLAYIAVLSFPQIQHAPQDRVAVATMNAVFGNSGAMFIAAAIMISTFGCNNGLILAGACITRWRGIICFSAALERQICSTCRLRPWSRKESELRS